MQIGAGTLVLSEDLKVNYPDATIRFDAFGVYGDVNSSAIIMASNASAMEAYKWTITNGVAGRSEERRVGKECRSPLSSRAHPAYYTKKQTSRSSC